MRSRFPSATPSRRADVTLKAGFTLTELVLVIAILGIVGAVAGPRYFEMGGFTERFFFEEVRVAVTYAQRLAVASGCETRVTLDGSGYTLLQRASCTTGAFVQPVANPRTGVPGYSGVPPGGVGLSSTLTPVVFDALGRARDAGGNVTDVTVTVGPRQFDAVGETGLVFAPGP